MEKRKTWWPIYTAGRHEQERQRRQPEHHADASKGKTESRVGTPRREPLMNREAKKGLAWAAIGALMAALPLISGGSIWLWSQASAQGQAKLVAEQDHQRINALEIWKTDTQLRLERIDNNVQWLVKDRGGKP